MWNFKSNPRTGLSGVTVHGRSLRFSDDSKMAESEGINRTAVPEETIRSCAGKQLKGNTVRQASIAEFPAIPETTLDLGTSTITTLTARLLLSQCRLVLYYGANLAICKVVACNT